MKAIFVLALLFISSQVFADNTCGGNCPSGNCPYCPCGDKTSYENITTLCSNYSEWNQTCCQCVMSYASGGNANALAYIPKNASFEVGIFQINDDNWVNCSGGSAPCDTNSNLQCAINIWKKGDYSFKLWPSAEACGCTENEIFKPKPKPAATNLTNSTNSTHSTNSTDLTSPTNSTQPSSPSSNPLSGLKKALSGLLKPSSSKPSASKPSSSKPSSSKPSSSKPSSSKGSSSPSSNSEDAFNWY